MTDRKLSTTGEAAVRRLYPDFEDAEAQIQRINDWTPKPPRSYALTGRLPTTRDYPNARAFIIKMLGEEEGNRRADAIDAWADQRNAEKAAGKRSTLYKPWTPERLEKHRKNSAERQKRWRERQKAAAKNG